MKDHKETEIGKIETSFVDAVAGDNLAEIGTDLYEAIFDGIMDDGILKEIPWFGIIYKGYKAFTGVQERFFAKKILRFLYEIREIPVEERCRFVRELEENSEIGQSAGETLLYLLEKFDDMQKPVILARLLASRIAGHIDLIQVLRLSAIVNRAFMPDLAKLERYEYEFLANREEDMTYQHLVFLGLIYTGPTFSDEFFDDIGVNKEKPLKSNLTKVGNELLKYGLIK